MPGIASKLTWNKIDYPKTKRKTPSNSPLESLLYARDSQQINMEQNRLPKNQMKNTFRYLQIRPSNCFYMPRMDSKLTCTKSTSDFFFFNTLLSGSVYIYMLSAPPRAYLFLNTRISSINLSAKTSKRIITIYLQSKCTCLGKHIKSPANKTCLGSLPYSSITLHQINPPKCTKQKKKHKKNKKTKKPKKPSLTGRCLGTQHSI